MLWLCPSSVGEKAAYQEAVHSALVKAVDGHHSIYIRCGKQESKQSFISPLPGWTMSTTSPLNFVFPEETERDKSWHQSNLELESKIFTILDTYLQPSSGVAAVIAAQEITQLYPTDPATQTPGTHDSLAFTFLYRLWELFIIVVEQIPWYHTSQDKVIELMKAIRDIPNPTPITFDDGFSHGVKLWTDLPVLGAVLVDNVETHGKPAVFTAQYIPFTVHRYYHKRRLG